MDLAFLRKLGLTEYESRAYAALFKHGQLKAVEVAEKALVPNAKVYGVLQSLVDKNLAIKVNEKPAAFRGLEPKKAIAALAEKKGREIAEAAEGAIKALEKEPSARPAEEVSGKVDFDVGFDQRMRNSFELHKASREYYYILSSFNFSVPVYVTKARKEALKRGIDLRILVSPFSASNRETLKKYLDVHEVRALEDQRMKNTSLYVWDDRKTILVVVDPVDRAKSVSVTIDSEDLARLMKEYFLSLYRKARMLKKADL